VSTHLPGGMWRRRRLLLRRLRPEQAEFEESVAKATPGLLRAEEESRLSLATRELRTSVRRQC